MLTAWRLWVHTFDRDRQAAAWCLKGADVPEDATATIADQARAFLTWVEHQIYDGAILRGALQELKERVARLLYALALLASDNSTGADSDAARLWAFFSAVDPRQQPAGHRLFIESFCDGEPTERTLRDLWHVDFLSIGPPSMVHPVPWKAATERGFAGRAAVAELLQAVRGIAARYESGTGTGGGRGKQAAAGAPTPTHSPDFTSVDWFGTRYAFAKGNQAESVRVLWAAWETGGHSLSQQTVGDRINSTAERFELAKVFRRRKRGGRYEPHPAWGTMIQQDAKGSYRLVPPESAQNPQ